MAIVEFTHRPIVAMFGQLDQVAFVTAAHDRALDLSASCNYYTALSGQNDTLFDKLIFQTRNDPAMLL